ncbi:sterol desaturase family protein [Limibacillus sp. MBR-115]|jgi:sterol desaturase/sphingolipid hydroxylase (fatty acid hydroxylase superfamily)|uniref:sterol desaturase family protein n=1 Tax=Limibacillus sp. MBR-115 TaxID=3156465 RepID=UPI00339568C5
MENAIEELLTYKGLIVALWLGAFFVAERLYPAAPLPPELGAATARSSWLRLARNASLWLVNVGLSPLIVLPLSLWASGQILNWRPDWWSGALGLAFDLILLDFLIYWWHRANHVVGFLWRFHEVHHLDRFLDTTSALRFHFGEVVLSALARAGVIILLGMPFTSVVVFEVVVLCAAIFHHSNLRLPAAVEKPLSKVFVTPSIHWVHHHAVRKDTDSNYGTLFSFWDRLFASFSRNHRQTDMVIGVEARPERSLLGLLARPFTG